MLHDCVRRQKFHQCRPINFTSCKKKQELRTLFKSYFTRLAINSGRALQWDFVNVVADPWPFRAEVEVTGLNERFCCCCCLNVINVIDRIISFIQHKRVLCLSELQYPLLLFSLFLPKNALVFMVLCQWFMKRVFVPMPVINVFSWINQMWCAVKRFLTQGHGTRKSSPLSPVC